MNNPHDAIGGSLREMDLSTRDKSFIRNLAIADAAIFFDEFPGQVPDLSWSREAWNCNLSANLIDSDLAWAHYLDCIYDAVTRLNSR